MLEQAVPGVHTVEEVYALMRVLRTAVEKIERGDVAGARSDLIALHTHVLLTDHDSWTPEERAGVEQNGRELAEALNRRGQP